MNRFAGTEPEDATPLTDEELHGLKATWVASRADLNIAEQENILDAVGGLARARPTVGRVLDDHFLRRVHQRMFARVWSWAGTYRTSERNIGCAPEKIAVGVRDLLADAELWFTPEVTWTTPERAAARFHHRLVCLHPFPNGNGRHARLYTNLLLRSVGLPEFTWGGADLATHGPDRAAYLRALRTADRDADDLDDLVRFART